MRRASAAIHVIDDVLQRCRAGEPERSLTVDSGQWASAIADCGHLALPVAAPEAGFPAIPKRTTAVAQNFIEMQVHIAVDGHVLKQMARSRAGDLGMVCQTDVMQTREVELDEGLRINLPHLEVRHSCQQNRPGTRLGARSCRLQSECYYGK